MPNPDEIMRSDIFDLETPNMSKDAQVYCEKYVEASLIAYVDYQKLPNIELQTKTKKVKTGKLVEIMTSKISDVISTDHGVFFHSIGNTQIRINLIKKEFLVNVKLRCS